MMVSVVLFVIVATAVSLFGRSKLASDEMKRDTLIFEYFATFVFTTEVHCSPQLHP